MTKVAIIDYGAGNIKSLQFAFKRLGIKAELSSDPEAILKAERIVFPGVGEASSAMKKISESKLNLLIPALKQPVLGICLGMQLMCNKTEEGDTKGLGIFKTDVKRFSDENKVPQIGWNTLHDLKGPLFNGLREEEFMYSVHSYYVEPCPTMTAKSFYHIPYAAALQHKNFYGVQFHPEKSSDAGSKLLKNFLEI